MLDPGVKQWLLIGFGFFLSTPLLTLAFAYGVRVGRDKERARNRWGLRRGYQGSLRHMGWNE